MKATAFTLIELLVAIAIILILIAIALPGMNQARTRALEVRARSELKTIAQCLGQYAQDFHFYPLRTTPNGQSFPSGLNNLTTPIAYLKTGRLLDPFPDEPYYLYYRYWPVRPDGFVQDNTHPDNRDSNWFLLSSNGPDFKFNAFAETLRGAGLFIHTIYSPTNGTGSAGNIWHLGGAPDGVGKTSLSPVISLIGAH